MRRSASHISYATMRDVASRYQPIRCRLVWSSLVLFVGAVSGGCASKAQEEQAQPNLRSLAAYYREYRSQNRGNVPANEKEFKKYITTKSGNTLSERGITVDELFISTRDGKPFVVKYRDTRSWPLPDAIAYERDGRDGVRHVASSVGSYDLLSDDEFAKKSASIATRR